MRYELMFPAQIRTAIDGRWPVIWPVGVLEYHAEHCCVGVDTLLVMRAVEALEREMNLVNLPPFYYGASSYVVAAPERNGSVHVGASVLQPFGRDVFRSLLRVGFRTVHVFIHHQSENFAAGMPTDLAFRLAAREATFEFMEKTQGEDWWGTQAMQHYYEQSEAPDNPFNWIQVHPLMDETAQKAFPIDHAGKQESSLMMALCPEGIDMDKASKDRWYAGTAAEANPEYGLRACATILDGMRKALRSP